MVVPLDARAFGENGDPALFFEVGRIHRALLDPLVVAEGARLAEQLVDEGRLAVVDVRDDRDVAKVHVDVLKKLARALQQMLHCSNRIVEPCAFLKCYEGSLYRQEERKPTISPKAIARRCGEEGSVASRVRSAAAVRCSRRRSAVPRSTQPARCLPARRVSCERPASVSESASRRRLSGSWSPVDHAGLDQGVDRAADRGRAAANLRRDIIEGGRFGFGDGAEQAPLGAVQSRRRLVTHPLLGDQRESRREACWGRAAKHRCRLAIIGPQSMLRFAADQRPNFSPFSALSSSSLEKLKSSPMRASWRFRPSTILASPSLSAQNIGPPR